MPDMMSMSPEVQAFSQGAPGPDQTEELFKQKFNEMAYGVLYSKFANLAQHIVTFKILEADPDEGRGIGVFILNYEQQPLYVPVILVDSKLKPFEMFYCKSQNIFLPFTPEWLQELSKMNLAEMGDAGTLPKEVPQDVNIKDIVAPPMVPSGRFGFASDEGKWDIDSKRMFKEAEFHPKSANTQGFLTIMQTTAPKVMLDGVKLAFERNPQLLQKFASNYGIDALTRAMREGYARANATEKTASVSPGEVNILTKEASSDQLKSVFGSNASAAFSEILKEGYAVNDTRSHIEKVAIKIESAALLYSPGPEAGWYRLYFSEGNPAPYFVVPHPITPESCSPRSFAGYGRSKPTTPYLVISADGKEAWTADDIVGEKLFETEKDIAGSRIGKLLNTDAAGNNPSVGDYGFFLNVSSRGIEVTKPFKVEQVTTVGGTKKVVGEYASATYILDGDPSRKTFNRVMGGAMIFAPNTAKFITIKKLEKGEDTYSYERKNRKTSVIKDPKVLLHWMNKILTDQGATPVNVKSAGLNEWWIGQEGRAYSFAPALQKVANAYAVSVEDATGILQDAQKHGNSTAYVLDRVSGGQVKEAFVKLAQPPMPEGPMQYQSMPGQQQGLPTMGDPSMMSPQMGMEMQPGMDPMAMQQPPGPPPISPTDLAIGEAIEGLQQQNQMQQQQTQSQMEQLQQQVQMQQQNNEQLVGVLQGIQQRSSELSAATGGQIPQGAEQSPAMAAQALAPVPPQEPPPPPMPMMDAGGEASPEMVAQQINPELVDQAEQFQDQGMFDTAAIGMLAAAPILQDIVASYVPNLEKGVDNLGRVLLTLWMKEKDTKEAVGDEQFIALEDKIRTVFKTLGDVVLSLSHNAVNAQTEAERAKEVMQTG